MKRLRRAFNACTLDFSNAGGKTPKTPATGAQKPLRFFSWANRIFGKKPALLVRVDTASDRRLKLLDDSYNHIFRPANDTNDSTTGIIVRESGSGAYKCNELSNTEAEKTAESMNWTPSLDPAPGPRANYYQERWPYSNKQREKMAEDAWIKKPQESDVLDGSEYEATGGSDDFEEAGEPSEDRKCWSQFSGDRWADGEVRQNDDIQDGAPAYPSNMSGIQRGQQILPGNNVIQAPITNPSVGYHWSVEDWMRHPNRYRFRNSTAVDNGGESAKQMSKPLSEKEKKKLRRRRESLIWRQRIEKEKLQKKRYRAMKKEEQRLIKLNKASERAAKVVGKRNLGWSDFGQAA